MSKIAFISDIHSNIHALNLVFKDMEKRGVNRVICLGDLVVKYFYPREVVDEIKSVSDIVIKGNCDDLVATNENYKWARSRLGLDNIEYLYELPSKEQIEFNGQIINLFHANPNDLEGIFNPLFNDNSKTKYKDIVIPTNEYYRMFIGDGPQTTIVGHTHLDYIGIEKNKKLEIVNGIQTISNNDRAIINTGSVGEHNVLVKNETGNYESIINPYITYLILDDSNLENGFNAEIIKIPYKEELIKVFIDSIDGQIRGDYPYSPAFVDRMAKAIKSQNDNEELSKMVDEKIKQNKKAMVLRK